LFLYMPSGSNYGRWIAIAILLPVCAWLVYRNLLAPADPRLATPAPPSAESPRNAALGRQNDSSEGVAQAPARVRRAGNGELLSQEELASLDPTLREDLLERSRQIAYAGSTRNIFQYYTPPPPPAPPAPPAPPPSQPVEAAPARPAPPPPPPPVALKFYGIAAPPGAGHKKAFLTDGEEIIIAQEGETIARFYKIIRIGVNSIELEDSRSKRRQSLPLLEE
jgi:hypothetical protein